MGLGILSGDRCRLEQNKCETGTGLSRGNCSCRGMTLALGSFLPLWARDQTCFYGVDEFL